MEQSNTGQNPKPSFFSLMKSSNMDLFNSLASIEAFNTNNIQGMIMPLSSEVFSYHHQQHQQPHLPIVNFNDAVQRSIRPHGPVYEHLAHLFPPSPGCNKTNETSSGPEILMNSSPSIPGIGLAGVEKDNKRHQNHGGRKRKRGAGERSETEKPREVVHVRAKRGQATDSHSLAERLRREKINEKLRCLQDLVPGCYKTMGMAVMLDVIINYVRSLQNQIDFLSMKLSAASLFYDFNSSEAEAIEAIQNGIKVQQGTTGYETQGMDKLMGEGYEGIPQFQAPWSL